MSESITDKKQLYNNLLQAIKSIAEEDVEKIITHFYTTREDVTLEEIATALGVSKQRLQQKYPNLARAKKEANHDL